MALKSDDQRYGAMAIALHWSSAAAIILLFASGLTAANFSTATPPALVVAHAALGTLTLLLTLARIVWWIAFDRRPAGLVQPRWQHIVAQAVHGLLYVALLVLATSGIATLVLSGAVPSLLAGGPVPDFDLLLPRQVHGLVSRLLLALLALHVGAALYHQFVCKDGLMSRMGVGQ